MTEEQKQVLSEKYLEMRSVLLEYAESSLHNNALSEDAVQQTFEIACRKIDDYFNSPNPRGWLLKTLSFVIRNIESRQWSEQQVIDVTMVYRPDLAASPEVPLPLHVTYGSLVDTPQFRLLYETEVMGRTLPEIAEELGISKAACKKRIERARAYLRKKLRK